MIGESVCSKRESVSRRAASSAASNCSRGIFPIACACIAARKSAGRGILPMGSVGIGIGRPPAIPWRSQVQTIGQQYYKNTTDMLSLSVYLLSLCNPRCLGSSFMANDGRGISQRQVPSEKQRILHVASQEE